MAQPSKARRGRPMSETTQRAILDAMPALLAERGYAALTFDEIALRARVGKSAIYRRWDGKPALVAEVVRDVFSRINPKLPDTGDARGDLVVLLSNTARLLRRGPFGAVLRSLVAEAAHDDQLGVALRQVARDRSRLLTATLARIPEVRAADHAALVSCLAGPLYYRLLVSGEPITPRFAADIVARVLPRRR
jgi:AcrR family transcriptional regulator